MTVYGVGFISISVSITTSSGISTPSGNELRLIGQWLFDENYLFKMRQTNNGGSYVTTKGKVARAVELKDCVIYDDDANATTNTQSLNQKLTFIRQFQKIDGTQAYLTITPLCDNPAYPTRAVNVIFGDEIDYLKGYFIKT